MRDQITSGQNPKIKAAIKLNDRRQRDETGTFLIEGYRELKRAVAGGVQIDSLFFCPPLFLGSNEKALIQEISQQTSAIYPCEETVFKKLSYRDRPDGLIAIGVQMKRSLQDLFARLAGKEDPFLVVAEAIEKPGNLGTILRSADAAGVDAVIVCDRCTDIYNPNVVRASVGTLFTIPVIEAKGVETLAWLKRQGIQVVAATPSAEIEFTEANLTGGVAIAVGTEQLGLSERWMGSSDIQVRIPMCGVADSLNVATATTLLLYEVLRQKKHRGECSVESVEVLFCDNHILIAFKPAGLSTQPHAELKENLTDHLKEWVKKKFNKPGRVFLEPIHRLDRPVSGLVIFARTSKALSRLQEMMREKKIHKTYYALVEGTLPHSEGVLEDYLFHGDRIAKVVAQTHPEAKFARLRYRVIKEAQKQSQVEIELETGRYHQIRAQFSHQGCPIVGDQKYGSRTQWKKEGIALVHGKVSFPIPRPKNS